jgi:hypothetical protein
MSVSGEEEEEEDVKRVMWEVAEVNASAAESLLVID